MEAYFELDVTEHESLVTIDDEGHQVTITERRVDFGGAQIRRMGQREDYGETMLVWIEADDDQIALLPQGRRRG